LAVAGAADRLSINPLCGLRDSRSNRANRERSGTGGVRDLGVLFVSGVVNRIRDAGSDDWDVRGEDRGACCRVRFRNLLGQGLGLIVFALRVGCVWDVDGFCLVIGCWLRVDRA